MTDNGIDIAKLARKWAADCQGEGKLPAYGIAAQAAAEYILATTTPLTMADVDWNDEKHHLAGATTHDGEEVVMVWPTAYTTDYITAVEGEWRRDQLTPNGKKYELREVGATEEPEHPATLETRADYANAPVGTVVAEPGGSARTKGHDGNWYRGGDCLTNGLMADTERDVLRWGWGK